MAIPEQVIQEIKYRNDIENAISNYITLKRRGKNLVGLCPFHNEKTPSFTVYPENGSFYCFGCGVGGDVFTFTKLIENLDYIDAVKLLAERSGVEIPQDGYDDSMHRLKNTVYEINREAGRFFHQYLMSPKGKTMLDYLLGRGLTVKTIRHFGLGAAPDSWDALIKHLTAKGFSIADMLQANVIGQSSKGTFYDRFRNRVMFPIFNIRGNVVAFSGRALPGDDKKGGKYVNTSDTPVYKKGEHLFGFNFAKANCAEKIILVEGNMDVISLHQAGFTNVVAALGTAFTDEQAKLISRYTKEIVLIMDADEAGQKAVRKAGEILKNTGLEVRVVNIPDGKDPDEYIKKHGAARFDALINGAVSEIEYKLSNLAKTIDVLSDSGKLQYLSKAAEIIAQSNDDIARDLYIGRLCNNFDVSRTALESKVQKLREGKQKAERKKEIKAIITPHYGKDEVNPERRNSPRGTNAEENVIAILLQHPDFCDTAIKALQEDDMLTSLNRRVYKKIIECYVAGIAADISHFGESFSPAETGYIASLLNGEKGSLNAQAVLSDSIQVILQEKKAKNKALSQDTTVDDWADDLKRLIENKQKGNKNNG